MTDEKLLKIDICSRMPYKVKALSKFSLSPDIVSGMYINGAFFLGDNEKLIHSPIKPILYPISCLTEEIRFRGEKIVPIEIIGKTYAPGGSFGNGVFGWDEYINDDYQDYYIHWNNLVGEFYISCDEDPMYGSGRTILTIGMVDALNRLMIDYRGLIDKGLAVSVFDLKENPYEQ